MMSAAPERHLNLADRPIAHEEVRVSKDPGTAHEEFLARMSHEFRTPLNAVIGFARVLENNRAGNQRPEDLQLLARLRANGEKLLRLVEHVLEQARIERGELTVALTDTNVVDVTSRIVEHYRPHAAAKGVRLLSLLPESAPSIPLDATHFAQVVAHLLDNAVKFTPSGAIKVTLMVDSAISRPSGLIIADTGVGIPSHKLEQIFMPFEQADGSSRRAFNGAGLGLSLALDLCHAMGCRLTVDSEVGKGSRFAVRFPTT